MTGPPDAGSTGRVPAGQTPAGYNPAESDPAGHRPGGSGSEADLLAGNVPSGFRFSQSSLQDYSDCRRRFQLRYLMQYKWPAVESEPALENEHFLQQGILFHHLAYQLIAGVPPDLLEPQVRDPELRVWWQNFLEFSASFRLLEHAELYPEMSLAAGLGDHSLMAKFDLIVRQADGRITIYDWKTSQRRADRNWLAQRIQTRLYPYLLVRAGASLNHGMPIEPSGLEMVYWFASFPQQAIRFPYNDSAYSEQDAFITGLVDEILRLEADEFYLTSHVKRCAYCVYRSLCERGTDAGALDESEEPVDLDDPGSLQIDFDQISEIPL